MTRISRSTAALLVLCAALLLMLVAAIMSLPSHVLAAANASAQMTDREASVWEYQTMFAKSPEALVAQANQRGTESWELVSANACLEHQSL